MSQAENLLNSLTATVPQHRHPVPDSDTYFIIDPYSRQIENTNYQKTVLMQLDHNSERFTFELPRYVDGHDMSLCNRVIVHFDNVGETTDEFGEVTYNANSDVAYTDDLRINPNNPETVICSWLIRREATSIVGVLSFSLQYQCVEADNEVTYEWNTDSYDDIEIRKSKQNGEGAVVQYSNILEEWRSKIFGAGDSVMANITSEGINQVAAVQNESAVQQAAIELKGSETLATIPDDYTEVYNMANEALHTKGDAIVCDAEGEIINVTDASDDRIRGLKLYGRSTQATTTGKNKVNLSDFEFNDSNYTHTLHPTSESASALYEFLRSNTGSNVMLSMTTTGMASGVDIGSLRYYGPGNELICAMVPNVMHTIKELPETFTCAYIYGSTTGASVSNLQIEFGETATDYEPYTGGIPAPNPEYPQEIKCVENPEIVILGKNLLRDSKIQKKTAYNGVTCEYEGDGVFHVYGTFNGTNPGMQFATSYLNIPVIRTDSFTMSAQLIEGTLPDDFHPYLGLKSETVESKNWFALKMSSDMKVGDVVSDTSKPGWILDEPTHIARFWIYSHNDELTSYTADFRIKVWVERNEVNTGHEPSYEDAMEVNRTLPGIPVTSGGNYTDSNGQEWICDEIDFERGVYVQRIFNKTFTDFSAAINYSNDGDGTSCALAIGEQLIATKGMCSHLPLTTNATGNNRFNPIDGVIYFKLEGEYTLEELKAKLTEMSPTVIAILATPIEIPLTDEELFSFSKMHTNFPNTTVFNNAAVKMEVKYNADTKLYISNTASGDAATVVEEILNDTY